MSICVIAEFDKGQIAANRLNLLDYRTTNYLAKIKTLTLIFDKKDKDDIQMPLGSNFRNLTLCSF